VFGPIGGGKDYDGARPLLRIERLFSDSLFQPFNLLSAAGIWQNRPENPGDFSFVPDPGILSQSLLPCGVRRWRARRRVRDGRENA
jgi:hypothetical protein